MRLTLAAALTLAAGAALAPAASAAAQRPSVSGFAFSPATFAVGAPAAAASSNPPTTIRFKLSKRSTVSITIAKRVVGRRSRSGRCVKSTASLRNRKACTRWRGAGSVVASGQGAGARSLSFTGRLKGKALTQGTYRATIVAIDASKRRSAAKRVTFKVRAPEATTTPTPPTPPTTPAGSSGPQRRNIRPCSVTLPSVAAVASAVSSAAPGSVICLAAGTYGKLTISGNPAGEVVVQPAGIATIAGASLGGSNLTLEGFNVTDEVTVQPGTSHITVQFNRITGGYMGVNAGPTTTTTVNDVTIRGNQFVGPFGEDAIRLNRYHDADGDGNGALVEGNEFTGVRENGNHSDCLQTVWVGDHLVFRRNYLHDNRCQGFFVKDQASAVDTVVADNNLMLRNAAPCASGSCGQPAIFQLFGPITRLVMTNNTIWTREGGSVTTLRESGWGPIQVSGNVVYKFWADDSGPFGANYSATNNLAAQVTQDWPAAGVTIAANPPFANPGADDYRLASGQGVNWAPADQHYGP